MTKGKNFVNLETLARGAFAEKINEALLEVAENIQNPNTDPTAKREITVKLKFAPNKTRQVANTAITVTTKLAATEAIDTEIVMGKNLRTGLFEVAEYDPLREQMSFEDVMAMSNVQESVAEPVEAQEPQPDGKPLDLRNRGKKQETAPEVEAAAPGRDYDPETGEVLNNTRKLVYLDRTAEG